MSAVTRGVSHAKKARDQVQPDPADLTLVLEPALIAAALSAEQNQTER